MSAGRLHRAAVLLAGLLSCAPLLAEPVTVLRSNGAAARRVDIAILGDGYTAAQAAELRDDAAAAVEAWFAKPPFDAYRRYFNVRLVEVASAESGADHPSRGEYRDTALGAAYDCAGIERLICVDTGAVYDTLAASGVTAAQSDVIWVLVNDPAYGGSGGAVAVASTHPSVAELVLHEAGHSFGLLADEYTSSPPACVNAVEPAEPNVTISRTRATTKWRAWIDAGTPVPTTGTAAGVPGVYEGGRYCTTGMYRPTHDSLMATLGRPFEQVNEEQLVKRIYARVPPIDTRSPLAARVGLSATGTRDFTITTPRPVTHALEVNWFLDGQRVAAFDGRRSVRLDGATLAPGEHRLWVRVRDRTAKVRNDPDRLLVGNFTWTVTVR